MHTAQMDDDQPPTKRMRFQNRPNWGANKINIMPVNVNIPPTSDTRKRKIPIRRVEPVNLIDLNLHVLLEIFGHLSLEDLCNLAECNSYMSRIAQLVFRRKIRNGVTFNVRNPRIAEQMLHRILLNFGFMINSITLKAS